MLATIIISALLVAAVAAIVIKMVHDRKAGKSSCSCGCSDCPGACACHSKD